MKVLIDHNLPFLLAHGGFQGQIQQTKCALEQIGIEINFLRWWDELQEADIIHFFGNTHSSYIDFAHSKRIRVVLSDLRGALGSRAPWKIALQKAIVTGARRTLPPLVLSKLGWDVHQRADALIALTPWEKDLFCGVFGARPERVHVIPNGVEDVFFERRPVAETDWLICTATITDRKRILELAHAAVIAETPVWFIGKPYAESGRYYQDFLDVARAHPDVVRYEGAIEDRRRLADVYRGARGFVLLSTMETLSLSALEAAASGCQLLLPNLPWATLTFGRAASYCPNTSDRKVIAKALRGFYSQPQTESSFVPLRWREVAERIKNVYELVCGAPPVPC